MVTVPCLHEDLVYNILKLTAGSDLCACSLVCRRWQLLAQPFIFNSMKMHNTVTHNLRRTPSEARTPHRFFTFLTAKPRICSYVRTFSISENQVPVDMALLLKIVPLFKRLKTLLLINMVLELKPGTSLSPPLPTNTPLQELKIATLSFSGIKYQQGFYALLRMFTVIDHLNADSVVQRWQRLQSTDVSASETKDDNFTDGELYPAVERMSLGVHSDIGFWDSKRFTKMVGASASLHSVTLRTPELYGVAGIVSILPQLPSKLRSLELFLDVLPPHLDNSWDICMLISLFLSKTHKSYYLYIPQHMTGHSPPLLRR